MPGPLPTPNPRRRNAPTIPTTSLPAAGRPGPAPEPPYELRAAGRAWWAWAYALPQACGWSDGDLYVVARRAALEDDLAALGAVQGLDFEDLGDRADHVRATVARVAALATGRLQVCKEMRELDDRLGLSPKGLAALRWSIVGEQAREEGSTPPEAPSRARRLRAVDPAAS